MHLSVKIANCGQNMSQINHVETIAGQDMADIHQIGALIQYDFGPGPNMSINPTVIYSTWITNGMPQILSSKSKGDLLRAKLLSEFFIESGLDLIVSGHQPIGDSPLTIRVANEYSDKPRFVIIGDTSYSADTIWEGSDGKRQNMGRGNAKSGRGDVAVS